jgi:hypothetical protein
MSQDDPDPIASTQMFRRFTDDQLAEQSQERGGLSAGRRAAVYGALLAVIVIVAVIVWLILR